MDFLSQMPYHAVTNNLSASEGFSQLTRTMCADEKDFWILEREFIEGIIGKNSKKTKGIMVCG